MLLYHVSLEQASRGVTVHHLTRHNCIKQDSVFSHQSAQNCHNVEELPSSVSEYNHKV